MVTSMRDLAKASDLFGINKSEEFQVDVEIWSAALPTELAGQLVIGLVLAVLYYTFYFK